VHAAFGPLAVDYDSFMAVYLPAPAAAALKSKGRAHGLKLAPGLTRRIELPWHAFDPDETGGRTPPELAARIEARPVPNLFLVQFAFPIREEWLAAFPACGIEPLAYFHERTFLVRAPGLAALHICGNSAYFGWIDAYLTTDRVSTELIAEESPLGYSLQFPPGTDLGAKRRGFPASVTAVEEYVFSEGGAAFLQIKASAADLGAIAAADPDLLAVVHAGSAELSDERQGQIVAGNHNGAAVTVPGYRSWLSGRGLLSPTNQQIVAVHDSGYDDGSPPSTAVDHHPDLESPERLLGLTLFGSDIDAGSGDRIGHGTMVAGIIVGEGTVPGTGAVDPSGYLYGSGIAPGAKLVVSKITDADGGGIGDLARHSQAFAVNRNNPNGTDRAFIANQSWNEAKQTDTSPPTVVPKNEYTAKAKYFDERVLDANESLAGPQPMTIVFSAGNYAYDYATGTIRRDSVSSPATAKNVIAVGATASYRPTPEPPLDCRELPDGSRPPNQDALHIARLGLFSGRGKFFSATGVDKVHTVRVKPDLVAPGVRVFSTVPYNFSFYGSPGFVGCTQYYPSPPVNYHTYGTGTSFSAPVVSGVAALKRKWFLDRGAANPSPSLIKAALLATADNLGPSGLIGNDHRPSANYGWGRVSLNRLTDSLSRFYVTDNQGLAVATGQQRTWTRTIGNPASDIFLVLAWSDPSADVVMHSQAALKNNLSLGVDEIGGTRFWRGNNFNENVAANDNGYSYRFSAGQVPFADGINNVEAIFIPANTFAAGQQLTIKVTGENVTTGTQKFALYAYNVQLSQ
jgi:Subtilase family